MCKVTMILSSDCVLNQSINAPSFQPMFKQQNITKQKYQKSVQK